MKAEPITRDEWLLALGDAVQVCDPDSLTARELCARYQMSKSQMSLRITALIKAHKAKATWKLVEGRRIKSYALLKP